MNYYKRHIGDYAKKAGHLSMLEHGAYTLILDAYYDRERAPTRAEAIRQARARTPDELAAVDAVLADFFQLQGDVYVQSRVEEEFAKAEEQARKNEANGKKGGRPRKPKGNRTETQSVLCNNRTESEKKPNPLIHQSTTEQEQQQGPRFALPAWLPDSVWQEWHAYRNSRKGWTRRARELSLAKLAELRADGHDPQAVIHQSIECGWAGLFPVKPTVSARASPHGLAPSRQFQALAGLQNLIEAPHDEPGISDSPRLVHDGDC